MHVPLTQDLQHASLPVVCRADHDPLAADACLCIHWWVSGVAALVISALPLVLGTTVGTPTVGDGSCAHMHDSTGCEIMCRCLAPPRVQVCTLVQCDERIPFSAVASDIGGDICYDFRGRGLKDLRKVRKRRLKKARLKIVWFSSEFGIFARFGRVVGGLEYAWEQ